eukprot:GILJ01024117.1.p1 GENE.GILJ01024117.1~~GILJ01024117.1.p1  ORF type:complete len:260 (-),score=27.27 GILJ01024117.1:175-954(-)
MMDRVGHFTGRVKLTLTSQADLNILAREGLEINGRVLYPFFRTPLCKNCLRPCSKDHYTQKCAAERRCPKCGQDHAMNECLSGASTCAVCANGHNTMFCPQTERPVRYTTGTKQKKARRWIPVQTPATEAEEEDMVETNATRLLRDPAEEAAANPNPYQQRAPASPRINILRRGGSVERVEAANNEAMETRLAKQMREQLTVTATAKSGMITRSQSASQQNSDASEESDKGEDEPETSNESKEARRRKKKQATTEHDRK